MAEYTMNPGTVLRIAHAHQTGGPQVVKVTKVVAQRSKFLRVQWMECEGDEFFCAVFTDPRNGEVYGQPTEE